MHKQHMPMVLEKKSLNWRRIWAAFYELLSSMRFAIALLVIVCIGSIIGTVVVQNQPYNNYVNQFGSFWAQFFDKVGIYSVYGSTWFLLILFFLIVSTSLCIVKNTPKIVADLKDYKLHVKARSLRAFAHHFEMILPQPLEEAKSHAKALLVQERWKFKSQDVSVASKTAGSGAVMMGAKRGSLNRIGYLATHVAIVFICLGALLDSDVMVRYHMWRGDKAVYQGSGFISQIGTKFRLPATNPTFRGNLAIPEHAKASTAVVPYKKGVVLQDLPFEVELKKFSISYYDTGMPKEFASDIVIRDFQTNQSSQHRITVNHPAEHRGVQLYQSNFEDGGSSVVLRPLAIHPGTVIGSKEQAAQINRTSAASDATASPELIKTTVLGDAVRLPVDNALINATVAARQAAQALSLEVTDLRVINVENFENTDTTSQQTMSGNFKKHLGAANKEKTNKNLRNIGPSISYKLRDASGQALEFHNYMQPVDTGRGLVRTFLLGTRSNPNEDFLYLRIPADEKGGMQSFFDLQAALQDDVLRTKASENYVKKVAKDTNSQAQAKLIATNNKILQVFAKGNKDNKLETQNGPKPVTGLEALAVMMEQNVPQAERENAASLIMRILSGSLFELLQLKREQQNLAPWPTNAYNWQFIEEAILALSETSLYPVTHAYLLDAFEQRQATILQVTRSPGRNIVYFGFILLTVGVFFMLYIRERRLWVWLNSVDAHQTQLVAAWSSNRKTLDGEREFARLQARFMQINKK